MKLSLSSKLFQLISIVFFSGTFVYGWFLGSYQSEKLLANSIDETQHFISTIAISIKTDLNNKNITSVESFLNEYLAIKQFDKITVTNNQGIIQTQLIHKEGGAHNTFKYGEKYIEPQFNDVYKHLFKQPVKLSTNNIGYVYVNADFNDIKELRYSTWFIVFFSGLVIYSLILIILFINLRIMLSPLREISNFTHNMLNNLGNTIDIKTNITEIDDMATSANRASLRLKVQSDELTGAARVLEQQVKDRTRELQKAKELAEAASEEKSLFLSRMSHELRTPLNAILGFSQLLMMKPEALSDIQISNINEINIAGNHLLSLVNEVLDISRVEEGSLSIELVDINVKKFFNDFLNSIQQLAVDNKVGITLENKVSDDVYLTVDKTRLTQIMFNLTSNAIKYNHENGKVNIVLCETDDDFLKVDIIDTGVGIEKENHSQVFNIFTRFDTKNYTEGAGIGLHLTKELVELMQGEIGFTSEYNKGSDFWFMFKITKKSTK